MEGALDRGEQIIIEGRDRVRELRMGENGLPEILRKFIDDAALDCDADIELEIRGSPRELRRGIAAELGQIAREALANACRHADASRIVVAIDFGHRALVVRVIDDGKGLNPQPPEPGAVPHFGLSGMRERAERLKASLAIDTAPGKGTDISVSLPSNMAYIPRSTIVAALLGRAKAGFSARRSM